MISKRYRNYLIRRYILQPWLILVTRLLYILCPSVIIDKVKLNRPIFIIGVSRSGTTLFIEKFAQHNELCNWSEAAQIFTTKFYDKDVDHYLDKNNYNVLDEFRLKLFFGLKTKINRKNRFVNKHPENSLRLRFIKKLWPDAIFVHIFRNPKDVVYSNYKLTTHQKFRHDWPFGQFPKPKMWRQYLNLPLIEQFCLQYVDLEKEIFNFSHECYKGNILSISYEEFCESPKEILKKVDIYCGLNPKERKFNNLEQVYT
ncbi:sulfotransferase, partial [bacterium]|nr:sulfotransferase [bacterium]